MFLPSSSTHLETDSHFFKQFITLPPTFLQGLIIEVICHTAQHFVGYGLNLNVSQACNKIIIIMEICKVPTPQLKALNKHNALCMYTEMDNVIHTLNKQLTHAHQQGFKYNYVKNAHMHFWP